jgi:hypothetical protein
MMPAQRMDERELDEALCRRRVAKLRPGASSEARRIASYIADRNARAGRSPALGRSGEPFGATNWHEFFRG